MDVITAALSLIHQKAQFTESQEMSIKLGSRAKGKSLQLLYFPHIVVVVQK